MEYLGLDFLLLGILWVAGFGYAHLRAVGKAKAAEAWPTAEGRILSCEVVARGREGRDSTWYDPLVTYAYAADGRELTGRRLRFGNCLTASRRRAEAALAHYPVGATPTVRFNPEKPEECVLEARRTGPTYLVLALFGLLFIAFGLIWDWMMR